jgi:hypothetical protein
MQQRSRNPVRRKVYPSVPDKLVKDSEAEYRSRVQKKERGVTSAKVQSEWLVAAWSIRTAKTPADALAAAEKLYGKPLLPPAGGAT